MTVPGGVPNLPAAALTLDTLVAKLQDQSAATMRSLANQRVPAVFDISNGGSILSDLTPFGIITRIWAEVNSAIANADPADFNGPEDIPPLLLDFITSLPVIGELVGLLQAIGGTYTGSDEVLLAVQKIFHPIRKLLQLVSGQDVGFPTAEEITVGWVDLADAIAAATQDMATLLAETEKATVAALGAALNTAIIQSVSSAEFISTLLVELEIATVNEFAEILTGILDGSTLTWLTTLLTALGLSTLSELADYLSNFNDFVTHLLTALGTGTAANAAIILGGAVSDTADATTFLTALTVALATGDFTTAANLVGSAASFVSGLQAALSADVAGAIAAVQDAASFYTTLLGDVGSANLGVLSSTLSVAVTNASAFAAFESDLLSDMAAANLAAVSSALSAGVTTANNAAAVVQQVIDAVYQAIFGGSSTGNSAASIKTGLEAFPGANLAGSVAGSLISGITTVEQNIIDAIANALGHAGTGHTVSDIATYLANIPGSVISGVTTSGQALIDAISNALGVAGTGHSTANVQTYLGGLSTDWNAAFANINAIITGLGGTVAADTVSFITAINTALQALKNALSGIFNPAGVGNVSLPNLVSQIQTGLQGILPAIVQNANGTASVLSSAVITLNSNGTATYNAVAGSVQTLVDQANGTMATVAQSLQAQAQAAIAQTGSNLTAAAAGVQSVLNGLFGAFGLGIGAAAPAATPVQAVQAVVSAQQSLLDNAAGLAALNALLTQTSNGGGLSVSTNFSSLPNGALPAAFTSPNNTLAGTVPDTLTVSGGAVVASSSSGGLAQYNAATTTGDQQIVTGIFTGVGGSDKVYLNGRVNSAGTSMVQASYTNAAGVWALRVWVAGSPTALNAYCFETFTNGAAYSLVCGTGAVGNRVFQILKNGSPLALVDNTFASIGTTFTEPGTTSQLGSLYRGGGFGLTGAAKLSVWTFVDNTPPAAVGSGFRAYRSSASTFAVSSGVNILAASAFDTTEAITADLSYNSATTNTLTVTKAGWYMVRVCLYLSTGSGGVLGVAVFKNGVAAKVGTTVTITGVIQAIADSFVMYCAAGDTLQPGTNSSGSATITGNAAGTLTYFEAAFMNRGTLS